jgi:hypothetical protein
MPKFVVQDKACAPLTSDLRPPTSDLCPPTSDPHTPAVIFFYSCFSSQTISHTSPPPCKMTLEMYFPFCYSELPLKWSDAARKLLIDSETNSRNQEFHLAFSLRAQRLRKAYWAAGKDFSVFV